MKRILALTLVLLLLLPAALGDTLIDGGKDRKIQLHNVGLNQMIEGVSPTTGRTLADIEIPGGAAGLAATGRYMPFLVQIDNAAGGVGHRAPWGAQYADIVYESPLYLTSKSKRSVETRISFLFSDVLPEAVGPVRSARVGHAWLREEWDCGFVFYGQQENEKANVLDEFKKNGTNSKGVLFSGISGGKDWKKYFYVRPGLAGPHNKGVNVSALVNYIPEKHQAANHTFLFTDEPLTNGKPANAVTVNWNFANYNSRLVYDEASDSYIRYMLDENKNATMYVEYDSQEPLRFRNVIVQHTVTDWPRVDSPVTHVVGEGNADYFMNGQRLPGYWKRDDMTSRTVYYDVNGNEMQLQRGTTLIILLPLDCSVSYAK